MRVVALVPAKDRADSVGATVRALRSIPAIDEVLVIDDASSDDTSIEGVSSGARVLFLPVNRGKGGAVAAGVEAAPDADVYLLIDADVGDTAAVASALLAPVLDGQADMTVGVLPPAAGRGGFGKVRDLARWGIARATGFEARAPLSGQRAVRGELLRSLEFAPRFGLEVGLTIDALRAGARVVEVDVAMEHRHTGKSVAGFRHRGRQGVDIVRALWPRLTTSTQRITAIVLAFVIAAIASLALAGRAIPSSVAVDEPVRRVVLVGMPGLDWDDVGTGRLPSLDGLIERGAVAATSVRTGSAQPSAEEAYATIGAGSRVRTPPLIELVEDVGTGAAFVANMDDVIRENEGRHLPTDPGALGDALRAAGRRTAVVGGASGFLALMDRNGTVDAASAQSGDPAFVVPAFERLRGQADVVLVDGANLTPETADRLLGEVAARVQPDEMLLVVSVRPPTQTWHTTPMVALRATAPHGYLHSPSVRRVGVVTLTDVAPTVLDVLGIEVPKAMIGHPLRFRPAEPNVAQLARIDRDATFRERIYFPITLGYIVVQALVYLMAMVAFSRLGGVGRLGTALKIVVLAIAAFPMATFVLRAIPGVAVLNGAAVFVLLAIDAVVVALALRARRHALSPLAWILGATVTLLCVDVALGARLQASSMLGYSLHTAARFTGLGNTAFAVLAASTVLLGAIHVWAAPRRREALWTVGCLFVFVVLIDGAPPLGDDVGGILTLVPVFGLTMLALWGRRLRLRTVLLVGLAALGVLVLAIAVDLLRPAESRTHLGQLVSDVFSDGTGAFTTTVARKWATNLRTYKSIWLWVIVIIAAYMTFLVAWGRGLARLVPHGSPLRIGVLAVLVTGLAGNFLNDSGAVVTALVFVFLGPYLTMLALAAERGAPVLLEPTEPTERVEA